MQLQVRQFEWDESQHPREPSGQETGGQFTPEGGGNILGKEQRGLNRTNKIPTIAESPIRFLIKGALDEAKLPDLHYDGLAKINFREGELIPAQSQGKVVEAYGIYDSNTREITLASNARSQTDDLFNRLGTGNIHVIGGATILHEIGHHVHLAKLTDRVAEDWESISQNGKTAGISAYARTNRGEHFAEAYRAYAKGGNARARLRNLEPGAYQFMTRLFRDPKMYLPKGQFTSANKLWSRYSG